MRELLPSLMLDDSVMAKASARFAEAFAQAWAGIPEESRAVIVRYFKDRPARIALCFRMDYTDGPQEAWGRCCWFDDSALMTFSAPFVERADPLDAVASVIAHELAHCYNRGSGVWTADEEAEEARTRELTATWGFVDPSPGKDSRGWTEAVEGWRRRHFAEFGQFTERWWIERHDPASLKKSW